MMFYDENTLYFETAKTDNLREPGFSKDGYNFEQKRDSGERLSPEYARKFQNLNQMQALHTRRFSTLLVLYFSLGVYNCGTCFRKS